LPYNLEITNKRTGAKKQLEVLVWTKRMNVVVDRATGQAYQYVNTRGYTEAEMRKVKRHGFTFPCTGLCEQDLDRPHLTCVGFCAIRRVLNHEIPELVPVTPYLLLRLDSRYRHLSTLKDAIAKKVAVLLEWLYST
jgi:hypothetical protein